MAGAGRMRMEWAESRMPVLACLRREYAPQQPLAGHKITGCLPVTKETGVLVETFAAYGAELAWSGCNPLTPNAEENLSLVVPAGPLRMWSKSALTGNSGALSDERLTALVRDTFDLRPAAIIKQLDLLRPVYLKTDAYGHFGRSGFSWEDLDAADRLRSWTRPRSVVFA